MPISIDEQPTQPFPWRDPEYYEGKLIYGKNEVKSDKERIFEQPGYERVFRRGKYSCRTEDYGLVKATHAWLSGNIQSPWYLEYTYGGVDEKVKICWIHIERYDERTEFELSSGSRAFQRWDNRHSPLHDDLREIAVIKGLVEPYSIKESFLAWKMENSRVFGEEHKNGQKTIELESKHPDVLKSFKENIAPMGLFTLNDKGIYTCPANLYKQHKAELDLWKEAVQPVHVMNDKRKPEDPDFNRVKIRYDDKREEFLEYWGKYFRYDGVKDVYYNGQGDTPRPQRRKFSKEYLDWMYDGIGPDPSLKPA